MTKIRRIMLRALPLLFLSLALPMSLAAQQTDQPAMTPMSDKDSQTLTGCLQRGQEANGFTLTDESGKMWELSSAEVNLADHVGHKVTVVGVNAPQAESHEEKIEHSEKSEAAGKEHGDLRVSSLKMISDSCR